MTSSIEPRIQVIGSELLKAAREEEARLAKQHPLETALLDWCMKNHELKARTFQFIDVFPDLRSAKSVLEHIREYFPRSDDRLPQALRTALLLTRPAFLTKAVVSAASKMIYLKMAKLFIGGTDKETILRLFNEWEAKGIHLSLDLLGESTASEEEAEEYYERYQELILALGNKRLGISKQNISIKLSALDPYFDPIDAEGTSLRVRAHLGKLVKLAREQKVFVHIDMEEYAFRDLTLKIVKELLEEEDFRQGVHLGIVLQAYLKDAEERFNQILGWAKILPTPLTIRLVRGAYWDSEIMKAKENGWPIPVFTQKPETDAMFERLTERILNEVPRIRLAVATHNIRSIAHAMALAEAQQTPKDFLEFQLLYGMGAPLMKALLGMGYAPRLYTPLGDPVRGMAYLVRRLLENVSSESFVRQGIHQKSDPKELLKPPVFKAQSLELRAKSRTDTQALSPEPSALSYTHTPPFEFHRSEVRLEFQKALEKLKFGEKIPLVIEGKKKNTKKELVSVSPLDGKTVIAKASKATRQDTASAVFAAHKAFPQWAETSVEIRAGYLKKAARWMEEKRKELASLQVYEVGKTWQEADADVCEAIDYLNFYAWAAVKIEKETATEKLSSETNVLRPRPRGVAAVIAPWNFPMAIFTGMSAAALVTGNTAVLKPSQESVYLGWKVFQAYEAAGFPPGVVNFLSGEGKEMGPALVEDPRVALIAFTGSKEAGLDIISRANLKIPGQTQIKKLIIEMGGKNAAIVDETADFDQAIPAVLHSAFSYAGQKCSALSRLIVLDSIYEPFLKRLAQAASSFTVGDPRHPRTQCGPVINENAKRKIETYIEEGKRTGRVVFQGQVPENTTGYFVAPAIIENLPPDSRLLQEEIFGPVLAVIRVKTFEEAIEKANETEFALTGGVFSRTPSHIELAKSKFEAGNLYINRATTGAVVGRQPFGGYKMSGGGTKAGGINYLREFFMERTVSENISRHGFSPLL